MNQQTEPLAERIISALFWVAWLALLVTVFGYKLLTTTAPRPEPAPVEATAPAPTSSLHNGLSYTEAEVDAILGLDGTAFSTSIWVNGEWVYLQCRRRTGDCTTY